MARTRTIDGQRRAPPSSRPYAAASRAVRRSPMPCRRGVVPSQPLASAGVKVSASTSETRRAIDIVIASGRKNAPGTPPSNPSGSSTATGVSVEPTSAGPISLIDANEAAPRDSPARRWRCRFSTTTMASSRMRPMPAAMPPRVMRLNVMPRKRSARQAMSTVAGITRAATPVAHASARKRNTVATASSRPIADGVAHAVDRFAHQVGLVVEGRELNVRVSARRARRHARAPPPTAPAYCRTAGARRSAARPSRRPPRRG